MSFDIIHLLYELIYGRDSALVVDTSAQMMSWSVIGAVLFAQRR